MAKSRIYQVISNRIQFKCDECKTRRSLPVPPNVRRRSVRCHNCGTLSQCQLNRRLETRQMQSGRAILLIRDGREVDIDLHDISLGGVGFDVAFGAARKLSVKQDVQFRCGWNPRLLDQGRYVIKSIKGHRIGVQNIAKNM